MCPCPLSSYLRYYELVQINYIGETVILHGLVDTVGEGEKSPIVPEHGPVLEVLLEAPLHHVQGDARFIRRLLNVAEEIGNSIGDLQKVEPDIVIGNMIKTFKGLVST